MCRTGLNNAELLLHEKENTLVEFRESLNQEKILNTNLTNKYDQLHTQYETEKENYQLQHSQLTEKVKIIIILAYIFLLDLLNYIIY